MGDVTTRLAPIPAKLQRQLQPYADLLQHVLVPEARTLQRWKASRKTVTRINKRVNRFLRSQMGFVPHPAITYFALRLCCHYHFKSEEPTNELKPVQWRLLDSVFRLIVILEQQFTEGIIPALL